MTIFHTAAFFDEMKHYLKLSLRLREGQEAKFLERFTKPRRGTPPDAKEIMRYWEYLKTSSQNDFEHEQLTPVEFPEIPSMKSQDIFMLICRKLFNAKILTSSSIFFAISFEFARRWNFFIMFFTLVSILIFIVTKLQKL